MDIMAGTRDHTKSNYYHQTIELHLDIGAEVLRKIISNELNKTGSSLKDYLKTKHVKKILSNLKYNKVLFPQQWKLLYPSSNQDPDSSCFDTSLLTLLIVETNFSLSRDEIQKAKDLRRERNHMSHLPKAELNDKTHFNVTSNILTELSAMISKTFTDKMKRLIDHLQKREFVIRRSILDVVNIRNEELMVLMIDRPDDKTVDATDITYLKYGLTKWTKQFSRTIDLDSFLIHLKKNRVLSETEKLEIQKEYNMEEQCGKLIMKMMDETQENLWMFCKCLRSFDENLANLIENKNDNGKQIEAKLKEIEDEKIRTILKSCIKYEASGKITSEQLHVMVENEIGYSVQYSDIERELLKEFDRLTAGYSFQGVCFNDNTHERQKKISAPRNAPEVDLDSKGNLIDKTCEALAEHIYTQCEKVRQGSGEEIKQHIIEECITPSTFKDMTKDEFSTYLSSVKIPFGILKALEGVQSQIRRELSSSLDIKTNMILRNFDSPAAIVEYMKGKVKTQVGNLMVPAHAFRMVLDDEMLVIPDIIKQSIKFVAACMNGKQNGTIHFGIKSLGNGLGLILGLESTLYSTLAYLDFQLRNSIETCFEDVKVSNVKRCVRPFQIVCVEDGTCVIELDVIPLSAYATAHSYSVIFPPKGKQDSQLIVFSPDFCEIFCFKDKTKWEEVKSNCVDYLTRQNQESVKENHLQERKSCAARLVKALTAGGDYVTDQFTPIICCGKISENENEDYIRQLFDVPEAFLSSSAIFDFDSSVNLRNQVERGDTCFEVLTADKNIPEENDISDRIWVYCNGNTELDMTEMDLQNWYKHRFNAIKRIITLCGERIPFQRAIVIFLAFDKRGRKDPFLELAEDCIKSQFRGQCVVIAEADSEVSYLRNKLSEIMSQDDLSECFYTGMSWSETSNTLKTIFRTTTQCDYKLPCSNGHYILMTAEEKRKLNFTDIEIIGGEECKHISQADDDISRRKRKDDEQKKFYKGMDVSWWNFYYKDHVGPRDLHSKLLISAREKLSNDGKDLIETLNVWHQPGAGGSTSARYVLWCLSQFEEQGVKHSYRCCVVKQVTDDTAKQIYDFMSFKDDTPKPVILLTDNGNEDHMELLISRLNVLAYKHAIPRNLFALHIQVNRLSVLYSKCDEFVLKHALSRQEQSWFQSKYDQLEENKENVDTLIAFNVMRKGFDEGYIRRLTKELLSGVKDTEFSILKCLSLINTFGRDKVIPMSTFDCLVDQNNPINQSSVTLKTIHKSGPFGLVVPRVMARQKANRSQHWNVDMTDQLALLIKRRTDPNGVMLISQTLAKAVLEYIMGNENISLPNIVDYLLDVVQQHANKKNQMAKKFVEIVCSLFKTRSLLSTEENKEAKARFSDMVLSLMETNGSENDNERNINAAKLMHRCFKITSDPMVGQQLARFYIFMQEFESAENAINLSLELKPKSSYLVSTCGEVYKTKMEYMVKESTPPISDVETAKIIDTAFNAIDKFILGQKYARMVTNVEKSEITCFSKEIITTLSLLDNFKRFSCYQDRNNFLDFLNQPNFEIEKSTFKGVAGKCDIRRLQKGTDTQKHMEESLRRLQENHYQIKNAVYLVDKFIQEKQLDNFRERFETFYGTKESQCGKNKPYIAGLKSLMQANKKHKEYIHHRVTEAEINLQHLKDISCLNNAQTIDLLLVLGYKLIEISKSVQPSKAMSIATYEQLLHYSNILVEQQRSSSRAYLEAFLFFAILNWPSERRLQQIDCLCKPDRYKNILKQWRESFIKNHSNESFAKTYFVLGKGDLGCDIVDLDVCIRLPWYSLQRKEKRLRTNVSADNIWKQKFVVDRLQRLSGQCDGTGDWIEYKIVYRFWDYEIRIKTYKPCRNLKNRRVTFVLGFTWEGLVALDVEKSGNPYSRQNTVHKESAYVAESDTPIDDDVHLEESVAIDESLLGAVGGEPFQDPPFNLENDARIDRSQDNDVHLEESDSKDESLLGAVGGKRVEDSILDMGNDAHIDKLQDAAVHFEENVAKDESLLGEVGDADAEKEDLGLDRTVSGANSSAMQSTDDPNVTAASNLPQGLVSAEKSPVERLNNLEKNLKYKIETTGSGNKNEFSAWVEVRGTLYEGKGQSKKDAKKDAARNALADLCDEEVQASKPSKKKARKRKN